MIQVSSGSVQDYYSGSVEVWRTSDVDVGMAMHDGHTNLTEERYNAVASELALRVNAVASESPSLRFPFQRSLRFPFQRSWISAADHIALHSL